MTTSSADRSAVKRVAHYAAQGARARHWVVPWSQPSFWSSARCVRAAPSADAASRAGSTVQKIVYRGHAGLFQALGASATATGLRAAARARELLPGAEGVAEQQARLAAVARPAPPPLPLPARFELMPGVGDVFRFTNAGPPPMPYTYRENETINIATMTPHYFSDYERKLPNCSVQCEYRSLPAEDIDARWADALWCARADTVSLAQAHLSRPLCRYHAPSSCGKYPERAFPTQLAVVMSMESAANAPCLAEPTYMRSFDIEMTYRITSDIPITYLRTDHLVAYEQPIVPFEQKSARLVARLPGGSYLARPLPAPQRTQWCTSSQTAARRAGETTSWRASCSWAS